MYAILKAIEMKSPPRMLTIFEQNACAVVEVNAPQKCIIHSLGVMQALGGQLCAWKPVQFHGVLRHEVMQLELGLRGWIRATCHRNRFLAYIASTLRAFIDHQDKTTR
ncbi:hypothetical protein T265_02930 [Opisthorchis viverrini]|uniref:Uncharacterized protein n=1 Tax=Opisthorchis viverrini TaxID=6198 RepID=A0A074ZXN9_OPIVI|nr:hypothetical protein T265_02930 [Opisthorchis viverrini]KER30692.1 hypothetical protein T265_02930 [Opisthorchis viverrini]